MMSIPGVGKTTAIAIIIEMPELGAIENKAAASLAGLAPIARDAGHSRGKRFIRGGRAYLRQGLYMPALVAVRFSKPLKAKYQAFIAARKPPQVALTAIMRKLLILANALIRDGRSRTATLVLPRQIPWAGFREPSSDARPPPTPYLCSGGEDHSSCATRNSRPSP